MKLFDKKKCKYIIYIVVAIAIVIVVYGILMKLFFKGEMVHKDFMNKKIFSLGILGSNCCSFWPISHLVLYTILAFIFPDCLLFLFLLGVLWEGIEMTGGVVLSEFGLNEQKKKEYSNKIEYSGKWVHGSFKDIVFNSVGIALGFSLRKAYDKIKKK